MPRIVAIDAYKAFLILLVVLGHALQVAGADFDRNLLVKFIYSHHMAAFFFLSGYVAWREQQELSRILRRAARLLVPFFGWWLILWLVRTHDPAQLWPSFRGLLRAPDTGLWFLYVLAGCHLVAALVVALESRLRLSSAYSAPGVALVLMAVELKCGWRQYGFDFLAWYYLFYLAGTGFRRYLREGFVRFAHGRYAPLLTVICLLAWLALLPAWRKNTAIALPGVGELSGMLAFGYRFVVIVLAIAAESLFFARIARIPAAMVRLGQMTLGIYVLHGLWLSATVPLVGSLPMCLSVPILGLVALFASLTLAFLLKKLPPPIGWLI